MQIKILLYFFMSSCCFVSSLNAFEITAPSLFPKRNLQCYNCSTLHNADCKNSSRIILNPLFLSKCKPEAQGCVKQFVKSDDGIEFTVHECYYGSISPFFKSLACEATNRERQYDVVQCYKCRGNLCNNSNNLQSKSEIKYLTLTVAIGIFIFRK